MSAGRDAIEQSEAFLLHLQANDKERERFEHDVLEYMVKLGETSGFKFTAEALEKVAAIKYKLDNIWHPPR